MNQQDLPGVHGSPNIQTDPEVYEIENRAVDPEGRIEAAMADIAPWDGKVVLDLGAGTGFHLPRFHERARHVIAVEPHGPSRLRAMARVAALGLERVSVMIGSAEEIPLRDNSVDLVHARFAYFFGPGCETGLREVARVVRPGGIVFIIDNELRTGTFASWLRRVPADSEPDASKRDAFWSRNGFAVQKIESEWRFERRDDLESVVRLEFPVEVAEQIIREHEGLTVDYHYSLISRRF